MRVKFTAEFLGTAFLLMIVVGSGVMAQNLFQGNVGLALLANSIATGAGLFVIIQTIGSVSGSHLNPVVSLVECLWGRLSAKDTCFYVLAQTMGAYIGVVLTHLMFNHQAFELSLVNRSGSHLWISELIATFGLIVVIALSGRKHVEFAPLSIAAYITSAYWFTSSTSFANPAVTFGRMFTNTFTGIDPSHVAGFVCFQVIGAILAWLLVRKMP